jgi:RimJ/RimL family protein N-acetyltransferase
MWGDPIVIQHILPRPLTEEEVWHRLLRYSGSWSLLGMGYWVVREKATGVFFGEVGLSDLCRDISPSLGKIPEAGWVLSSESHGRGFATESVLAILDWAVSQRGDEYFDAWRTVCIISRTNSASVGVAAKCGYKEIDRRQYREQEAVVLERTRGGR